MNARLAHHDATIGTHHGEMADRVRNPFRTRFAANAFAGVIRAYDKMVPDLIYPGGRRCYGNTMATYFWRGFDGAPINWDRGSKTSAVYAAFRAGAAIRAEVDKMA